MSDLGMIQTRSATGVLGANDGMLWRVPADFARFKVTTMGCGLVMGRTTRDSLGGPLLGRRSVILARDRSWRAEGTIRVGSLREGLLLAARGLTAELGYDPRGGDVAGLPRLWVIDGGRAYERVLSDGLPGVLVVSILDLDATQRVRERDLPDLTLVRAPETSTQRWVIDPALSDPRGQ